MKACRAFDPGSNPGPGVIYGWEGESPKRVLAFSGDFSRMMILQDNPFSAVFDVRDQGMILVRSGSIAEARQDVSPASDRCPSSAHMLGPLGLGALFASFPLRVCKN